MQREYILIERNYTPKTNRKIEYIVIHYTAGVTSKKGSSVNTAHWFNSENAHASAHYIVDDVIVTQAVADNNIAWHCGDGHIHPNCTNANSIGIEICSSHDNFKGYDKTYASDPGWYITKESKENAAQLTAELMQKYNIPIDNVIRHYDVSGKDCPSPWVDENKEGYKGWVAFLDTVKKYLPKDNYETIDDIPEWGKDAVKYFVCKGYINGTGNGKLDLNLTTVRLIVIMYRILDDKGVL